MKHILYFHQSADMYGSDKVLLSLLISLDKTKFRPVVLLPCQGLLCSALADAGIEYHVIPLILASRQLFTPMGLIRLPFIAWRSMRAIGRVTSSDTFDVVHSNTLAVLSGALWAKLNVIPHVWHVHEIIEKPWIVRKGFGWLLRLATDKVVCNSIATLRVYAEDQPIISGKSMVVYNGLTVPDLVREDIIARFRDQLGINEETVLVTLVGRIHRWKGQQLLVDAAEQIVNIPSSVSVHFLLVGGPPPNQESFMTDLQLRIDSSVARDSLTIMPFTSDISTVWAASDVAVVPSTEPEPFGMVAIEAMAAEKPVIAANHGGLKEIVRDGETGILFEPNNAAALADAIIRLMSDAELRGEMGVQGCNRYRENFSLQAFVSGIEKIYSTLVGELEKS